MNRYQMTRDIFPKIKKSDSILDKSERFAEKLKTKDQKYKLPNGCRWADIYLQIHYAPHTAKKIKYSSHKFLRLLLEGLSMVTTIAQKYE